MFLKLNYVVGYNKFYLYNFFHFKLFFKLVLIFLL